MKKIPKWIYAYKELLKEYDERKDNAGHQKVWERLNCNPLAPAIICIFSRHNHGDIMHEVE